MQRRLILLLLTLFSVTAAAIPVGQLPLNTPVVDEAGVLTGQQVQTLAEKIRNWQRQGIMQAGVVIVKSTGNTDDFRYAMAIFDRWRLGSKTQNNGLLLLAVTDTHQLRLITGYGLEGALPDISAKAVIRDDITPYFKKRQYARGIEQGLTAVVRRLQADPEIRQNMIAADKRADEDKTQEQIPLFVFGTAFLSFLLRQRLLRRLILPAAVAMAAFGYFFLGLPWPVCLFTTVFSLLLLFAKGGERSSLPVSQRFYRSRSRRNSDSDSYRGGGGSSGGGGAGGSW